MTLAVALGCGESPDGSLLAAPDAATDAVAEPSGLDCGDAPPTRCEHLAACAFVMCINAPPQCANGCGESCECHGDFYACARPTPGEACDPALPGCEYRGDGADGGIRKCTCDSAGGGAGVLVCSDG